MSQSRELPVDCDFSKMCIVCGLFSTDFQHGGLSRINHVDKKAGYEDGAKVVLMQRIFQNTRILCVSIKKIDPFKPIFEDFRKQLRKASYEHSCRTSYELNYNIFCEFFQPILIAKKGFFYFVRLSGTLLTACSKEIS
jgi:hypothetical protein